MLWLINCNKPIQTCLSSFSSYLHMLFLEQDPRASRVLVRFPMVPVTEMRISNSRCGSSKSAFLGQANISVSSETGFRKRIVKWLGPQFSEWVVMLIIINHRFLKGAKSLLGCAKGPVFQQSCVLSIQDQRKRNIPKSRAKAKPDHMRRKLSHKLTTNQCPTNHQTKSGPSFTRIQHGSLKYKNVQSQ